MFSRSGVSVCGVFIRSFQQTRFGPLNRVTGPVRCCRLAVCLRSLPAPLPADFRSARRFSRIGRMPRKEKAVKGQAAAAGGAAQTPGSGPVTRDKSGAVTITVHAKPGSKLSSVTGVSAEKVDVSIAAPPTDGEANAELVRYLAGVLDLKKSHLSLDKGSRSRDKLIRVDSSLSPEEVLRRLREAAG
ncbi:UPF0235 protein C15orf40 homolog [Kryptolebias marmoratus]|uniref:Uncharacterized protein n=1 Tax=Kryptolebias marmoratus TaxID=37003 RepID=A0A3Q3B3N2_KRYMA|nr:UPF0235 protein C15orf40 homolog [Kryptolebias marmoratus]